MNYKKEVEKEMQQVIDHFVEEIKNIRTGRANPGMVENVTVEVYGAPMKLRDIASITTPESRQILITPFDPKNSGAISNSIAKANLGFQPVADANVVRINIPPMDNNVRKEMIKLLHKYKEAAKVSVRQVRAKFNKKFKTDNLADDLIKKNEKEIQDQTDKFCSIIDEKCVAKENEISTI